jgi:uncharacterized HAD superfamily protein
MNLDEFMNEMGKQVEKFIANKQCIDYMMIKSSQLVENGMWKYYGNIKGIKDLILIYFTEYLNLTNMIPDSI